MPTYIIPCWITYILFMLLIEMNGPTYIILPEIETMLLNYKLTNNLALVALDRRTHIRTNNKHKSYARRSEHNRKYRMSSPEGK